MAEHDEQRFERLYREHFERVAAYLLSRADRTLSEDALARTFEIAWRRLDDLPDDPLPWLLGVARRALADLRRGQGRQDALIDRIAATLTEVGDDHAETLAERRRMLDALARLSESQREVLLLVVWDGLSQREAAAVLGCSRGAVALRLHRARARLRAAFAQAGPDDHKLDSRAAPPRSGSHTTTQSTSFATKELT
jgi:RNA polymerase sigma-70 factor, ECF subfamily